MSATRTNRQIRRAFGPEAMAVIAELAAKVERLEAVVASLIQRDQVRTVRESGAPLLPVTVSHGAGDDLSLRTC